jgi:hypothetical protein
MDFGAGFVEPYAWPWLNSLGVDLEDPATWGICSKILAQYPRLSELCVTGYLTQNYESFMASKLVRRMKGFQGSTLIFRNARFTSTSCRVLLKISKQPSITTLIFDRSVLRFWDDSIYSHCPLLPNLKKVKYVGTFDPLYRQYTAVNFCRTYLDGAKLTHFEKSNGFEPYCPRGRGESMEEIAANMVANGAYRGMRRMFLNTLRHTSCDTLEVYIDDDILSGTYISDESAHRPQLHQFKKAKLLVFRIEDLKSLSRCRYLSTPGCKITTMRHHSLSHSLSLAQHYHSIWLQLSYEYSAFRECECIVLESEPCNQPTIVSSSLWKFASKCLLGTAQQSQRKTGALRYRIVGNSIDGYCGIERDMDVPIRVKIVGVTHWAYSILESEQCRQLIHERY